MVSTTVTRGGLSYGYPNRFRWAVYPADVPKTDAAEQLGEIGAAFEFGNRKSGISSSLESCSRLERLLQEECSVYRRKSEPTYEYQHGETIAQLTILGILSSRLSSNM